MVKAFNQEAWVFQAVWDTPWAKKRCEKWIGLENNKIVTLVELFSRNMYIGKSKVLVGDIGNVSTLPEVRGKGYNSMLIKKLLNYMENKGYHFSILFGIPIYYEKLGWVYYPEYRADVDLNSLPKLVDDSGMSMCEVHSDDEYKEVIKLYQKYGKKTGNTVRDTKYWFHAKEWLITEPNSILLWSRNGQTVAFSRVGIGLTWAKGNYLRVCELCYDEQDDNLLSSLLIGILRYAIEKKWKVFLSVSCRQIILL